MAKIRIGTDFVLGWKVIVNRGEMLLEDLSDVTVELKDEQGCSYPVEAEIRREHIYIRFRGYDQKRCGRYSLTLWVNKGKVQQAAVDKTNAFQLVPNSEQASVAGEDNLVICPDLTIDTVQLTIGIKGEKGDKGDPANPEDIEEIKAQIREQQLVNRAQQAMIDENKETNDSQQEQIDKNTEVNENQEQSIAEMPKEMSDEDFQAIRNLIK